MRQVSCGWKQVKTTGNPSAIPDRIAYHTSIVYKDNMYVFGGNNFKMQQFVDEDQPQYVANLSYLNLRTFNWNQKQTKGD